MCNRYTPSRLNDPIFKQLGMFEVNFPPEPFRKIGPWGIGPFIRRAAAGGFEGVIGQWGMIRPGSKTRKPPPNQRTFLTNNARSETIAEKPTYRAAWATGQRCIIPVESYDEPNLDSAKNVWWEFRRADGSPRGVAGLWSDWTDPETGEIVPNYTMPTINADEHELMSRMHKPDQALPPDRQDKRSIVPLEPDDWLMWLTGSIDDARALLRVPAHDVFDAGPERSKPQRELI